jgi:hypothetical protein
MCQTAVAHQQVIVKVDTGESLRWRHLHAAHVDETDGMILHWVSDQHGGQAKGVSDVHLFVVQNWFQFPNFDRSRTASAETQSVSCWKI